MSEEYLQCYNQAVRYLAIREHNRNELEAKLKRKMFKPQIISDVIEELIHKGYLNEERYIRSFINSRNRKNPEGKQIMLMRLLSKNADKEKCKIVLDEVYTEDYIDMLIKSSLEKNSIEKIQKSGFSYSRIKRLADE